MIVGLIVGFAKVLAIEASDGVVVNISKIKASRRLRVVFVKSPKTCLRVYFRPRRAKIDVA